MKFNRKVFYLDYSKLEAWEKKHNIKSVFGRVAVLLFWAVYIGIIIFVIYHIGVGAL